VSLSGISLVFILDNFSVGCVTALYLNRGAEVGSNYQEWLVLHPKIQCNGPVTSGQVEYLPCDRADFKVMGQRRM
jgi:hypothetical protein